MAWPVVIKASGGFPVTDATNGFGVAIDAGANGIGMGITFKASGGLPVVWEAASFGGSPAPAGFHWDFVTSNGERVTSDGQFVVALVGY